MAKYYYIGTYLPALSFESPPEISVAEFDNLLRDNLTKKDYEKTKVIRYFYDILNIRSFWLGEELDSWGNIEFEELEEALVSLEHLPPYIHDFLEKYEKLEDRLHHFPELQANFFQRAIQNVSNEFLIQYLNFEREWRLVFTGFRAKKLGRELNVELQYENPEEELIAQMLAQKDAKTFEPPEKYQELKFIFEKYGDEPLALQRAIDEYRFNYIDQLVDLADGFSINHILAYMAQLIIVQKWFALDKKKGIEIIDTIVKEIS